MINSSKLINRFVFVLAVLAASPVIGQPSLHIDLEGEYNRGDSRYSGCWSYVGPDGSEYALLGTRTGTAVYLLDAPDGIEEVGFIPGPESNWREITVVEQHAYVVTEGSGAGEGMQVLDLSNLPDGIALTTTFNTTFNRGHIIQKDIFEESPFVFVCGTPSTQGVHIIDVSDPESPQEVGVYEPGYYIHDCHIRGDILYACAFFNQTVDIIDISDKSAPQLITTLPDPGVSTHSCSTTPDQNFLFLANESDGFPGRVFDISDLENITEVATYTANDSSLVHNPYILNDLVFISHNTEGLRVLDFADPNLPVEVGFYDTFDGLSGGFNGLWSACPYFPSGRIIGGDRIRGLLVWQFDGTRAGRLYGSVIDSLTGASIQLATVIVSPLADTLLSDFNGQFKFGSLPGDYQLAVYAEGYHPYEQTLQLVEEDEQTILVKLVPDFIQSSSSNSNDAPSYQLYWSINDHELLISGTADNTGNKRLVLNNASGKIVYDYSPDHLSTTNRIKIPNLSSGFYFAVLYSEKGQVLGKTKFWNAP
jgi:choice-of-anchor B domain-containing protein